MRKRVNKFDTSKILAGAAFPRPTMTVGEVAEMMDKITCGSTDIINIGMNLDFGDLSEIEGKSVDIVNIGMNPDNYVKEVIYEIARIAKERGIYFTFLYAYQCAPKGKRSHLDEETVKKLKEIAGEYFIGEMLGETGTTLAGKARGYFVEEGVEPYCMALKRPPQNFKNMTEAKEHYVDYVRQMTEYNASHGIKSLLVEACAFSKYNLEAGVDIATLEMMPGNPESLIAFTRGAAVGYQKDIWAGYIANEWYGGYRHEDELKEKRLRLAYHYCYLSGANLVYLESGHNGLNSFGYKGLDYDSPISAFYRKTMTEFYRKIKTSRRPSCGPVTEVAFLHGNLDAYTGFMGSSVWTQFDKEEWGKSDPENSWRILDEVYRSADWHEFTNFGKDGKDYSHAPAYGQYDVLPVESDVSVMKNYKLLIFAGWNTMTEEIYKKLKEYVREGGRLILTAAHLNTSDVCGDKPTFLLDGKYADFLGCDIVGVARTNDGVKFRRDGEYPGVEYPGTYDFLCDCNHGNGYLDYAKVEMKGGKTVAFFEDKFSPAPEDMEKVRPALIENKYGKGVVSLITHVNYPGNPAAYPLYKVVVKENLTQTHRDSDLKVICGDKVRFSLFYEETGEEKLYLLNTDFNLPCFVEVSYKGRVEKVVVDPVSLIELDF